MKRKLLHLFAVFMAIIAAIPIANAAASDYNVATQTPGTVWKHEFSTPGGDAYQAAVLPNGYIYVIGVNTLIAPNGDANVNTIKTLYRINENGVVASSAGYTNIHYGLASDDNGKIILLDEVWSTATNLDNISIRTPGSDGHLSYVDGSHNINLSSGKVPSFTYYFDATGNLENGTGYLWFPPVTSQNKLKVAKIVRGTGTTWTTSFSEYTLPFTPTLANSFIQVYESDEANGTWKFLYLNPNENLYDCTLKNGTITHTTITVPVARKASILSNAHIFYLGGHKMLAYNTGNNNGSASNNANQFVIYDMTTGTTIATVQPFSKTVSGSNGSIGSWINSLKVSDKQTDLMIYSPAAGASRLSLVATPITASVSSLSAAQVAGTNGDMNVTWGKPSSGNPTKYAVQYSTDGSTWSTAVETTNLNHTYPNLAPGTYSVRVRAYFGGNSTWGNYTTVNNVVIGDPTNPVQNLNATLVDGTKGEVNVTWSAPSAGSVSKYSICYSSDNGTTWSTAVETTSLSYTYNSLTTGTYTFKVKPYYSHAWGNDATSNSVTVINATGASISNLAYKYVKNTVTNIGRQDIVLMWEAPIGMVNTAVTGYKIYREGKLLATVGADVLTYTNTGVKQNYTYTVVPLFEGLTENSSYGQSVTTTEVETILYAPEINTKDIRNYAGYSIVEIFWQMPSYSSIKPATYNVYRNGVLLESGLTQYNFIDDQLPKISDDVEYTYTVEAVYGAAQNNETRTSQEVPVEVKARDWSLSGYQLQEVYNIPITQAIGNLPNNFTNHEYYRQGHFYNGSWYIAQRADNLSKKDDPNYTASDKGTEIVSGVAGTTGGVVSIKAIEGNDVLTGFTGKPITSEAFASVGLAIDDAGNIFMRYNNSNAGLAATAPTIDRITGQPVNWLTYISDGFTRRITRGAIYKHKGDGTYETEPTIINLDPLWTSNDWINTMAFTYQNGSAGDKNGQVTGRSDYYNMYGDVMSAEGGFLLISPSWTHCIFKVKVANGEYVNHETHDIKEYQSAEGQVNVKTGTENYGFKIDGRNAWVAQIRSNGYFGIHGEEDHAGEGEEAHEHITHAIFVADSRINNTGGTSIVAFDNPATAENDGETFLITPVSMYSRNQGDFIVTRGTKTNVNDLASEAKFMPPMPVAQIKQSAINSSVATNANGNWFHAEVGTYESATGEQSECVYIYQYVPGIRFAKYRLVSDLTLPVVSPTLEITTAYNDDNTEITHFNGKSTWQRPASFGMTDLENASVWIKSYTFELVDDKGNVVYTDEVPEAKDAEGNPVIDYEFDYVTDKNIENVDNCDLDFKTYTARIAVNYEFKNGDIQQSSFNYAIASNDYDAEKASDLAVHVFKKEKVTEYVWVENPNTTETTEDDWVAVPKEFDTYRVELDFNPPAWSADANPEPISYYTVKALVNNQTDLIEITDFHLHTGAEVVNGVEKATYEVASQIPGTYNFSQYDNGGNKAPFYHTVGKDYGVGGESRRAGVLTWHHKVDYGQYTGGVATTAEGDEIVITDEPNKWVFIVEAHYGAKNRYIAKSAEASIGVEGQEYIETGVEVVGDNTAALKIYPIPATTSITVKASEAINSIVIYNEAGVEVINEMGNGENITMVNIENLSTGFYFVKVNNYEPVKIIKK